MYLLVAAVIAPGRLAESRAVMRNLQMPGERRIHFQSEHDSRRRKILAELVANGTQAQVYLGSGRPDRVRAACLDRLVRDAMELDARRLVIESRGCCRQEGSGRNSSDSWPVGPAQLRASMPS
jgi:hypothetical protein